MVYWLYNFFSFVNIEHIVMYDIPSSSVVYCPHKVGTKRTKIVFDRCEVVNKEESVQRDVTKEEREFKLVSIRVRR